MGGKGHFTDCNTGRNVIGPSAVDKYIRTVSVIATIKRRRCWEACATAIEVR
jgi:hypothetical protein